MGSVATIKPNTTSDTLVEKGFAPTPDNMDESSDEEPITDQSPKRTLSNVLQPSRTELPKSSAQLHVKCSHEDMRQLIEAASSNCLLDGVPEEQSLQLRASFDDDDGGVKLRVPERTSTEGSTGSSSSSSNLGEVSNNMIVVPQNLPGVKEEEANNSSEEEIESRNSSLLTDVTPTTRSLDVTPTTPPLAAYNSVHYSTNHSSMLHDNTLDTTLGRGETSILSSINTTHVDPKCSFYNASLPTIANSSLDSTKTLENDENTPPFIEKDTSTDHKDADKKNLDLPTAAVLGGAIAGLSAYLYLK